MANDISVKISLDGEREYRQALKQCNEAMKNADSALKAFDESVKGDAKSVENLEKRQELLTKALEEAKKKQETLTDIVEKAKKARDKAAEAVEKARKEEGENSKAVEKAEKQYLAANSAVNRWETELNKANQTVAKYSNEIDGATEETTDFQKVVANTSAMEALTKVADKISGVFKGINKSAAAAAESIADGYATIIKKTGATGAVLEDMKDAADDLFTSMPVTMEEVGSAIGEVNTRFGLTGEALEDVSEQFLQFAKINGTDVSGSVDAVQKALAAFGEDASEVGTLLDVLNRTGQNTGISMSTLTGSLSTNAASFAELGLNIYEAVGFLGDLEVSGADSSAVMMGLRNALKEATDQGKPLDEALAELQETIVNGTGDMDGLSAAYEIFGTRAGAQVFNAVKNGNIDFTNLTDATNILADATGNLADTYEAALTPAEKMQIAQNNLDSVTGDLHLQFREALTPALETVTDVLKTATQKFKDLPPEIQTTIAVIGGIGTKVAEVLPQVLTLITQLQTLKIAKEAANGVNSLGTATQNAAKGTGNLAAKITAGATALIGFGIACKTLNDGVLANIEAEIAEGAKAEIEMAQASAEVRGEIDLLTATMADADSVQAAYQKATTQEKKAVEQLNKANADQKAFYEKYPALLDKSISVGDNYVDTLGYTQTYTKELHREQQILEERVKQATTAVKDASDATVIAGGYLDSMAESSEDAADAIDGTTDSLNGFADAAEQSEQRISYANALLLSDYGDTMKKVADAVNGVKDSLIDGAKSVGNWFDEVGEKQKLSADDLAKNLADQIEHMKNWEKNLKILANSGINEGLLQYLADMGPAGAEYVQAFVDAANGETEVGIEEMNRLWEEKIDIESGINAEAQEVYSAVGVLVAGSQEELDRMAQIANEAGADVPEEIVAGINSTAGDAYQRAYSLGASTLQGLSDSNIGGNAYSAGANLALGMINGINDYASSAINSAASVAQSMIQQVKSRLQIQSPSKVFGEIGMYVDLGLAQGIEKYSFRAEDAVTDMTNGLIGSAQLPDMSKFHETGMIQNEVKVYIGDQELTGIMAAGVIRNISTNQAAFAAAGGM